jgi:hypothetical protein
MIIERNAIADNLKFGAVGVGETHGEPYAADAIIECIQKGVVRVIFIDLWHLHFPSIYETGKKEFIETTGSMTERKEKIRGTLETLFKGLTVKSAEAFARLVAEAIAAEVPVWAAELNRVYLHPLRGATDKAVSSRNESSLEEVRKRLDVKVWNDPNAVGAVLLFGSDHFSLKGNGFVSLEEAFGGLPWWPASAG